MDSLNWKSGDIIGIKLDLKQRNVEYFINDQSAGITHQNIPIAKNIQYRLTVTMECDGHAATIKSFQYL